MKVASFSVPVVTALLGIPHSDVASDLAEEFVFADGLEGTPWAEPPVAFKPHTWMWINADASGSQLDVQLLFIPRRYSFKEAAPDNTVTNDEDLQPIFPALAARRR